MALGLVSETSGGGGDIVPIIKFDAKAGDLIRVDREQNAAGEWQANNQEMQLPVQIVMDMENVQVGWASFASGRPDFAMVNIGEPMPQKPSADHKQAFKVRLGNKELGLREFSSQSKLVISRFDVLHNAYEAGKSDNPGKVPVVTIEKTETVTVNTPQGENRFKVPVWSITGWVDRPDILDGAAPPVAAPSAAVTPTPPAPAEIAVEPLF